MKPAMMIVMSLHAIMMERGASKEQNAQLESTEMEHHVWTVFTLVTHVFLLCRVKHVVQKIVPLMVRQRRLTYYLTELLVFIHVQMEHIKQT
jgi:hypothetical protein